MTRVLVLCALAACSTFPDIANDKCGNYVRDVGSNYEDCDAGPDGSPWCSSSCRFICQSGLCLDGENNLVAGYSCGLDGLCHAPGGAFAAQSGAFPFTPVSVTTTDIDGDGIKDLVGVTLDTEIVHFGDRDGTLARNAVELVPVSSGIVPAFGDVDGDTHLDALVPTADGIAAMTSQSGTPLPFPFTNQIGRAAPCLMAGQPDGVASLDDHHVIVIETISNQLAATVLSLDDLSCHPGMFVPLCALPSPQNPIQSVAVAAYSTSTVATPGSNVVAVSDGSSVCIATVIAQSAGAYQITTAGPIANTPVQPGPPVLAQITGTAVTCPDLVLGDAYGTWKYAAKPVTGGCSIDLVSPPVQLDGAGTLPAGHARLAPPIAAAAPDALAITRLAGVAGQSAIFAYVSGTPQLLYQSTEGFSAMEAADLDGDMVNEIVVASHLASDIQILHRTQKPDGFLLERVPTTGVPVAIVLRDFDGNGLDDIAFVEVLSVGANLDVAYGTPDRTLPPVVMASFTEPIFAVIPAQVADAFDPSENAEDLVVLQGFADQLTPGLTVLLGSAQRTMFTYFDPRPVNDFLGSIFTTVAAGRFFVPPAMGAKAAQDLFALEHSAMGESIVWSLQANGGGLLDGSAGRMPTSAITYDGCTTPATLCADSAQFVTHHLAGRDVVIGLDGAHHLATIVPGASPTITASQALATMSDPPAANLSVYRMLSADLDGDGNEELILPFRPPSYVTSDGARVVVCQVDAAGVPSTCTNLGSPGGALDGYDCTDVAAGRVINRGRDGAYPGESDQRLDLVAACATPGDPVGGAVIAVHAVDAATFEPHKLMPLRAAYLQVADVTGDSIDDLMLLLFDSVRSEPAIHVFPQCDAREGCK